jgi:hypothetical protein
MAAGTIGTVREAHVWFGGGDGPQTRPQDKPPVPADIDWDLWLGPAPFRPYHSAYMPAVWRRWRAFGSGSMGDMGCHTINIVFRALRLVELWSPDPANLPPASSVVRVHAEASEVDEEGYPRWMRVHYDVPARGGMPPVKLTFYTGGQRPDESVMRGEPLGKWGSLLDGEKGALFSNCPWNTRYQLLPIKQFEGFTGPEKTLPRGPGHHAEWIEACKGRGQTFSSFQIGGPLTELIQLGNAAVLIGEPIDYDTRTGKIINVPAANEHLHRVYREGWTL